MFPCAPTAPRFRLTWCRTGAATAKYAGQHVHQRLVKDPAYKEARYPDALKSAFLGTDADMKEGVCTRLMLTRTSAPSH